MFENKILERKDNLFNGNPKKNRREVTTDAIAGKEVRIKRNVGNRKRIL